MKATKSAATKPSKAAAQGDVVDRMLEVWKRELPELDLATEGIVERIQKLARYLDRAMDETLVDSGLNRGEWHLLGALRKAGPPYRRSPGRLAEEMGISSGAMTNRLDRLEAAGLIRRLPDPKDRRALEVELTDAGWRRWQETVGVQARKEAVVASALNATEKRQLNDLLRRLMLAFAEVAGAPPRHRDPGTQDLGGN